MIASRSDTPAGNLVLVDIGNTRVATASWTGGKRGRVRRACSTDLASVVEALRDSWTELPAAGARAVVVSSVCPPLLADVRAECQAQNIGPLLAIGEELEPPIPADVLEPDKLGSDRVCVAAAAFMRVKSACAVADFGTALTIDLVADNGVFLGGTILPGVALSARALHEHTALLPLVEVIPAQDPSESAAPLLPPDILGKDTESAIRYGVLAMMIGALREVVERYATQIGRWPPLVVTGGDAEAIGKACEFVDAVAPDLCLDGVLIAYQNAFVRESLTDPRSGMSDCQSPKRKRDRYQPEAQARESFTSPKRKRGNS